MDRKRVHAVRRDNQYSINDTINLCKEVVRGIDPAGTSPFGKSITDGDYLSVVNSSFRHSLYTGLDLETFRVDYALHNLLRKFPYLPGVKVDRKAAAKETLLAAEISCKNATRRIRSLLKSPEQNPELRMVLYHAKRNISSVLGQFDWDRVIGDGDFGPGASTRLSRANASLQNKLEGHLHLTGSLVPLFEAHRAFKPGLFDGYEVVDGNRITFVPKDAKIDRPIAIEPDYNMWVQKAIGQRIRKLLLHKTKERIDLRDQTHNQQLARLASLGFGLATVDLSSASDTISYGLVEALLDDDWLNALIICRSPIGTFPDGSKIRYQKWSSMGNGYTFELETLIFWALSKAVIEVYGNGSEYVSLYGDDIVISSSLYNSLSAAFSFVGFTINEKKSFHEGPFYESCGKHFFCGTDVTPLYVDKIPQRLVERIALANEIQLLASRFGNSMYRCSSLRPAFEKIRSRLPSWLRRPRAPLSCKGNALIGDFDECVPDRAPLGYEGWEFLGLVEFSYPTLTGITRNIMRTSLYTLEYRSYEGSTPSAAVLSSHKASGKKRIIAREWSYLGPWL